jgi:hypothetical protein
MKPRFQHPGAVASRLQIDVPDQPEPVAEIDVVRWMEQMRADLTETLGGIMLRAVRPSSLTVLPTQAAGSPGRLVGWSLRETGGTNPFVVRMHNGDSTGADVIALGGGPANGIDTRIFPAGGVSFTEGLFVAPVSGAGLSTSIEGVVYIGAAD